jgi:NAD+ diphosphatase
MEVSESYRFCPRCGASRKNFVPARPFRCESCGNTSFFGPVTAVGGVITNELGQIVLIERARDPGRGKLGMPGGFVDPYESAETALRREIQEEIGISVGELTFLMTASNSYSYHGIVLPVLDIFFTASIEQGQQIVHDDSEVSAWMWTDISALILERMAFASNRAALEHFVDKRSSPK